MRSRMLREVQSHADTTYELIKVPYFYIGELVWSYFEKSGKD